MKYVPLALVLVACRKEPTPTRVELPAPLPTPPTPIATATASAPPRGPLFPEARPREVSDPADALFSQETWTGATTWQQHCREWGLTPARETAERDRINTAF